MSKILLIFAMAWGGSLPVRAGTEVLNGGGGVCSAGVCTTFGSFDVELKGQPLAADTLKALNLLKHELLDLPISDDFKILLTQKLMPSEKRFYWLSDETVISDAERRSILLNYSSITGVKLDSLKLFALTSVPKNATYLLPDFFKLGLIEQEVLLFHEQLWLVNPTLNYQEVTSLEMTFQKYLQSQGDDRKEQRTLFVKKLARITGHGEEVLYLEFTQLQDSSHKILLEDLTGRKFIECLYENQWRFARYANFTCNSKLRMHLLKMSESDKFYVATGELLSRCEIDRDCVTLDAPDTEGNHPLILWIDVDSFDEFTHTYRISDEMNAPVGALKVQFQK